MCGRCTVRRGQSNRTSDLDVEAVDHDGVTVMAITGDIDITNADQARAAFEAQLNNHPIGIVVYLAVGFLASAGLSMLGEAHQRARQAGIGFAVVANERASRRPLEATGLDQVMQLHETVPHAVEALRTAAATEYPTSRSEDGSSSYR